MDARAKDQLIRKLAPWICVSLAVFAGYQLYEWFAVGRMYSRGPGGSHYISYAEHPAWFTYLAVIYVSAFLLFGCGSLVMLIGKFRRRR